MPDFPVAQTLGVLELGILISGVLFGVFTTQVYIYYKNFPAETLWIKAGLVGGMWLLELGHTICIFHAVYFYTVMTYGNPSAILQIPVSIGVGVAFHAIVIVMVQGYFAYRIARFGGRPYILPIILCGQLLAQLVGVLTLSYKAITIATKSLEIYNRKWGWLIECTLCIRSAVDILTSCTLVFYLWKERSQVFKKMTMIVDKLILWTIETGIVTSMLGIVLLIFYIVMPTNYVWLGLFMILPKVYSNTMLANMNSRADLRHTQSNVVMELGNTNFHLNSSRGASTKHFNIEVNTEVINTHDGLNGHSTWDGSVLPSKEVTI
ncbi:hypothetical protein J3R30DRAFT_3390625 [Lentinula aciculospora]|uniref:DUF6534 domain-containing protein n=1 Tax=Lentinula aciculospora TaxID=153920 RepID=A0A9W8ZUS2_9AGAR|nr:hypothetical protein J3R30DRAFT_3390625 [Lentinula aciculospora]